MATQIEPEEDAVATITGQPTRTPSGLLRRPTSSTGIGSWLTTVDHKRIGLLYGMAAFGFFLLAGVEALLMRIQLSEANSDFLSADRYNQFFTMHGTMMIFFAVMPLGAALANYLVPLMVGARDVAFPRLNALSFWVFLFSGLFVSSSILFNAAPNDGWFGYANLTTRAYSPGHGIDFWALGIQVNGIASLASAFNLIVTIINMRAPGLTFTRLPPFVWMVLVTQFLLVTAIPVFSVALFQITFDRFFGTNFFNVAKGGDPVLWQHLFWLFGHPEVYIMILPAFGIISEILPVFSRKPLFGYTFVIFSGIAIGFMGWGVWLHHMFAVGLGPVATSAFGISTMLIAVPTGVKIFNWLGTMWGGQIAVKTPLLFAAGFVAQFTVGGLSGVMHSVVPSDWQQTDTYFIVAHFHYVLFGGALFGLFGGIYYWLPKATGRLLDEGLGKWHFWTYVIGFNLTFFPMHVLGLNGMPRRVYTYPEGMGWELMNQLETAGAFLIALGTLIFLYNFTRSVIQNQGALAGPDPWDGRTLEWMTPSPPPEYNFATIPTVRARDPFWYDKYVDPTAVQRESQAPVQPARAPSSVAHAEGVSATEGVSAETQATPGHRIHMPQPSFYPILTALGLIIASTGLLLTLDAGYWWGLVAGGVILTLHGIYGWALEPVADASYESVAVPDRGN